MSERNGDSGIGAGGRQPSVLLTLGRLPTALELARAFAGAGWRVVVLDPMSWHLCRVSKAVHQCIKVPAPKTHFSDFSDVVLSLIHREKFDLVVPVSEESAYITALANQFPAGTRTLSVEHATWLKLHDKQHCMKLFNSNHLAVPKTMPLSDALTQSEQATEDCVLKKRFTAAGVGLQFVDAMQAYPAVENPGDWIVQTRLTGAEVSVFAVFQAGKPVATSAYTANLLDGSVSVAFTHIAVPSGIQSWLQQFGAAFDYTGLVSFDFMKNGDSQWCALECNPRVTSGIHFMNHSQLMDSIVRGESQSFVQTKENTIEISQTAKMEFWSAFTLCFSASARKKIGLKSILKNLYRCKDITWSSADPWPFLLMPAVSAGLLWRSFTKSERLAQSAVADISWPPSE